MGCGFLLGLPPGNPGAVIWLYGLPFPGPQAGPAQPSSSPVPHPPQFPIWE